jgi:hypothetical protein
MKKILTVVLVFVFAFALVFALGCNKKEETSVTSETQTTTPADGGMPMDSTNSMADTTAAPTTP